MVPSDRERSIELAAHPAHGCTTVQRIEVRLVRAAPGVLSLSYRAEADWEQVRLDAPGAPRRGDALWRHTCFEVFLAPPSGTSYQEFNFAPSLAWASYHFAAYRSGMSLDLDEPAPALTVERRERHLILNATVRLGALEQYPALRLALAAVIEPMVGGLCYWALRHAPGAPDFHHPDGFAVQL
jgi:hypothetical protein